MTAVFIEYAIVWYTIGKCLKAFTSHHALLEFTLINNMGEPSRISVPSFSPHGEFTLAVIQTVFKGALIRKFLLG